MVNEIETSDPMESGENGINWRQLFVDMRLASQQRKAQQESAHAESFVIDILKQVQAENSAPTVQNFLQQGALEILATQDLEDYWWSRLTELTHSRQSEALKVWVADNSTRMTEAQKVQLLSLSQRTSEDEEVAFRETGRGRFHGIEKVFGFPGKHGEQEEDDKEWIKGHEATEAMRQAAELTKEDLVGFWEGAFPSIFRDNLIQLLYLFPHRFHDSETLIYIGIPTLSLAILGLITNYKKKKVIFLLFLAFFALTVSFGANEIFYKIYYRLIPIFQFMRAPLRIWILLFVLH